LESQPFKIELIDTKHIDHVKTETDWHESEGTAGGYEGFENIEYDIVDKTWQLGSPVAKGSRAALVSLKQRHADLRERIETAFSLYEQKMPYGTVTERVEVNRKETPYHIKTVDNR
jgi:hypothetical protein